MTIDLQPNELATLTMVFSVSIVETYGPEDAIRAVDKDYETYLFQKALEKKLFEAMDRMRREMGMS